VKISSLQPRRAWIVLVTQSILAVYAYVFMEWLFFATKPSFMDALPLGKKLEVAFLCGLVIFILAMPLLLAFGLLIVAPGLAKRAWFVWIGSLVPALFGALTSLLMIDNFTYTIFKFGIVTSQGVWRGAYGLLAAVLLVFWYRQFLIWLVRACQPSQTWEKNILSGLAAGLLACSLVILAGRGVLQTSLAQVTQAGPTRMPNIILIGSDGVVANHMSLYGYERKTTPRLEQLAQTGLLAENNFTNAGTTTGSVFSMLTGRHPADTRLLYRPNILQGQDAYQHLPGILQRSGYKTVQLTFPYYVDAYAVNMQDGFDQVNGSSQPEQLLFQKARGFHLEDAAYFLPRLLERVLDRLKHIYYIRVMPDPYHEVIQARDPNLIEQVSDTSKIMSAMDLLEHSSSPVFIHIHLMGTHGEEFSPSQRVFSAGEEQTSPFMRDFYDDSILDFDRYMGVLVDGLTNRGLLDHTIIILYSDHADQWRADDRIPLLFRFPSGEYAGRIQSNTQNLDIAPTLLDYLGLEKPDWMAGQSLLREEPDPLRPIFSDIPIGVLCESPNWWCAIDPQLNKPPFYQFAAVQLVVCQKMWTFDLTSQSWSAADVRGHTHACPVENLPDLSEVHQIVSEYLKQNKFDISGLRYLH
jgi:hypothetical protein